MFPKAEQQQQKMLKHAITFYTCYQKRYLIKKQLNHSEVFWKMVCWKMIQLTNVVIGNVHNYI